MSTATNNVLKMPGAQNARPGFKLPEPRIWRAEDLATFLRVSISWVYRRTKKNAIDPPPRCQGLSELRFDTHSASFQEWIARQIGSDVDMEASEDV